jgi:hypothetical protein
MDEPSVTSANLDQTEQDFLTHEVPDEIVEAAAEALNICRMTFGGWPSIANSIRSLQHWRQLPEATPSILT